MASKWSSECPGTPQNRPRSAPGAPRGILRAAFGQPKELPGAAKARISKPLQREHHFRGPPGPQMDIWVGGWGLGGRILARPHTPNA